MVPVACAKTHGTTTVYKFSSNRFIQTYVYVCCVTRAFPRQPRPKTCCPLRHRARQTRPGDASWQLFCQHVGRYMSRSADQGLCTDTVPGFPASFNNRSAASCELFCSRLAAASQRSERPERNRTEREKTRTRTLHGGTQHGACHRFGQAGQDKKGPERCRCKVMLIIIKFRPEVKYCRGQRVLYILAIYIYIYICTFTFLTPKMLARPAAAQESSCDTEELLDTPVAPLILFIVYYMYYSILYVYVCIYVYIYIYIYAYHVCHAYYIYIYIHIHTYMCVYIYIYTHIYNTHM